MAVTLERAFAKRLREKVWPGHRLPVVHFDPRSLALDDHEHAVLHAKCVVVDHRLCRLTSANSTEAAQQGNIEAGVLVDDVRLAGRLCLQFHRPVEAGLEAAPDLTGSSSHRRCPLSAANLKCGRIAAWHRREARTENDESR